MNEELRDALGKALYEASVPMMDDDEPTWEEWLDKEIWMQRAEKVVETYNRLRPLKVSSVRIKSILDDEKEGKSE